MIKKISHLPKQTNILQQASLPQPVKPLVHRDEAGAPAFCRLWMIEPQ
jgi:hypothetical protein